MIRKYQLNIIHFVIKNFLIYSFLTLMNESLNPKDWWLFSNFYGGVIFTVIEFIIYGSCLTEIEEEDGN
jgi:hypothetical protein